MGIILGLVALFGWAVGDIFIAQASRKAGNVVTVFWKLLISFILASFYLPSVLPVNDWKMLFIAVVLGLVLFVGELFYLKALEIGNAGLAGAISGSYPALMVILVLLIYQERPNWLQISGMIITVLGIFLVSFKLSQISLLKDKSVKFSLIAMVLFALYLTLVKIPAAKIGWFWQPYAYSITFVVLLLYKFFRQPSVSLAINKSSLVPIAISSALALMAQFAYSGDMFR